MAGVINHKQHGKNKIWPCSDYSKIEVGIFSFFGAVNV